MRISQQGLCRQANGSWFPLASLATRDMMPLPCPIICFKGKPLPCTLLIEWQSHYDNPCLVITDLPPHQANPLTYHLRFWIEAGFKDMKRGGLHWERTQIDCPSRMARLWFVMSITLVFTSITADRSILLRLGSPVFPWLDTFSYCSHHSPTLTRYSCFFLPFTVSSATYLPRRRARPGVRQSKFYHHHH